MTVVENWFEEVWNGANEEAIDRLLAPGAVVHGLVDAAGNEVDGPEAFKQMFRQFHVALSNIHVAVEATVTEGDLQVARCIVTASHTGDGFGKPPLGKPIRFTGISIIRVKDGKIAEGWNSFDFMTMFDQMA
jgi:predicted ester cyclase